MNRIIYTLIFILFSIESYAHTTHYQDFKKIEMEILKDGKVIGYNYYFFNKQEGILIVKNQIRFKVSLFGVDVFKVEGYGVEKYKNNQLISFISKTLQNDKEKFVNIIYEHKKNKFNINGSSYTGLADANNIIGNWWNHQILQSNSQISPISGSVKKQLVTFLGKEKIELYGKFFDVDHFKLTSKDSNIPKDKRLNFDVWYNNKNGIIMKVSYSRMGNWEYRLKNYE